MIKYSLFICMLVVSILSCKTQTKVKNNSENITNNNNSELIQLTGIALDRKGGAIIDCNGVQYWIKGKFYWEDKYLNKKIFVEGILEQKADNPVFLDTSDVKKQGIPVSSEEELELLKDRFWIKNAKIKLLE